MKDKIQNFFGLFLKPFRKHCRKEMAATSNLVDVNDTITIDVYEVKKSRPTVFIHPILGGSNRVSEFFAAYFNIFHRWNVVIVHRSAYPFESNDPESFNNKLKDIESAFQQVYDWSVKYFEHNHFHFTGTSMGAIVGATLVPYIPFRSFICIMGGGSIPNVMLTSSMSRFTEWYERQVPKYGETREQVERNYMKHIDRDPVVNADDTHSHKMLMFSCLFDRVVHTRTQSRLNRAFKKNFISPLRFWLPCGHYTIALFIPIIMPIVSIFLFYREIKSRFEEEFK